jgi:hypothetical protein
MMTNEKTMMVTMNGNSNGITIYTMFVFREIDNVLFMMEIQIGNIGLFPPSRTHHD